MTRSRLLLLHFVVVVLVVLVLVVCVVLTRTTTRTTATTRATISNAVVAPCILDHAGHGGGGGGDEDDGVMDATATATTTTTRGHVDGAHSTRMQRTMEKMWATTTATTTTTTIAMKKDDFDDEDHSCPDKELWAIVDVFVPSLAANNNDDDDNDDDVWIENHGGRQKGFSANRRRRRMLLQHTPNDWKWIHQLMTNLEIPLQDVHLTEQQQQQQPYEQYWSTEPTPPAVQLYIDAGMCRNWTFAHVQLHVMENISNNNNNYYNGYYNYNNNYWNEWNWTLKGLSWQCWANYSYTYNQTLRGQGTLQMTLDPTTSSLEWSVRSSNEYNYNLNTNLFRYTVADCSWTAVIGNNNSNNNNNTTSTTDALVWNSNFVENPNLTATAQALVRNWTQQVAFDQVECQDFSSQWNSFLYDLGTTGVEEYLESLVSWTRRRIVDPLTAERNWYTRTFGYYYYDSYDYSNNYYHHGETTKVIDFSRVQWQYPFLASWGIDPLQKELVDDYLFQEILVSETSTATTTRETTTGVYTTANNKNNTTTTTSQTDLRINVLIREYLLDSNRTWLVDTEAAEMDALFFQSYSVPYFDEIVVSVGSMRVLGLDTIESLEFLPHIGRYTLQSQINWTSLTVEFDLIVDVIQYQQQSNSNIYNGGGTFYDDPPLVQNNLTEIFHVSWSIDNVDALVSVLVAWDADKVKAMPLGSILNSSKILPCAISALYHLQVTGLDVVVGTIRPPIVMASTASLDWNRGIILQWVESVFGLYEPTLVNVLPHLFQGNIRTMIQNLVNLTLNPADFDCPLPDANQSADKKLVDFRDLLLPRDQAQGDTSGPGVMPYGDALPWLYKFLQDDWTQPGLARLNDAIRNATLKRTQESGTFRIVSNLFDITNNVLSRLGISTFRFRCGDVQVENVDTLVPPLVLLEPNRTSPVLLNNRIVLGGPPNPLRVGLKCLLQFVGDDSSLSSSNEWDVGMQLFSPEVSAVLSARMQVEKFLFLPLRNIVNPYCWLATLVAPTSHEGDVRFIPALGLDYFRLVLSSLQFQAACARNDRCTSVGFQKLLDILTKLEAHGVTDVLATRLVNLTGEILQSNFTSTVVHRLLEEYGPRCNHTANIFENNQQQQQSRPDVVDFLVLSPDSMETLVFGVTVIMHVGMIIVAETHAVIPTTNASESMYAYSGRRMASGTSPAESTNRDITAKAIWGEAVGHLLHTWVNDEPERSLNNLIRSLIPYHSGSFAMPMNNVRIGGPSFQVSLSELRLVGLDTLTKANILEFLDKQKTARCQLAWSTLRLEVDLEFRSYNQEQNITFAMQLADVDALVSMVWEIDQEKFDKIILWQLLKSREALQCLLSSVSYLSFSELDVAVGTLETFNFTGFRDADIANAVEEINLLFLSEYRSLIVSSIRPLIQSTVMSMVNKMIKSLVEEAFFSCPVVPQGLVNETTQSRYIDIRDLFLNPSDAVEHGGSGMSPYGDLFSTGLSLAKNNLLTVDGDTGPVAAIGAVIKSLTKKYSSRSGSISLPRYLLNKTIPLNGCGLDPLVTVRVYDAYISDFDTVGTPLAIGVPIKFSPVLVNNTLTFGVGKPVRLGIRVAFKDDSKIQRYLNITINISDAVLVSTSMLRINESDFFTFPIREFRNINCWLATMPAPPVDACGVRLDGHEPSLSWTGLVASVSRVGLNITCTDCGSLTLTALAASLSKPEAEPDITELANRLFNFAFKQLNMTFVQKQLDIILNAAKRRCPQQSKHRGQEFERGLGSHHFLKEHCTQAEQWEQEECDIFPRALTAIVILMIIAIFTSSIVFRLFVYRRNKKHMSLMSSEVIFSRWRSQKIEKEKEARLNEQSNSMFESPEIPVHIRYAMPFTVVGNMGLFLSGHLCLGAKASVHVMVGGTSLKAYDIVTFSLAKFIIALGKSGGKGTAAILMILSGLWPYARLVATLSLWFLPPRFISSGKRGSALLWLDTLAKWSIVEIMFLILMFAGFRLSLKSSDVDLPNSVYSFDVFVIPQWGFYSYLTAQLISQMVLQYILVLHRHIDDIASQRCNEQNSPTLLESFVVGEDECRCQEVETRREDDSPHKLCNHAFAVEHGTYVVRGATHPALFCMAGLFSLLTVIGCVFPSASFQVHGLMGILVNADHKFNGTRAEFSVFGVMKLFVNEAALTRRSADNVGLILLCLLLLFSVLVIPILTSWALVIAWFNPFRPLARRRAMTIVQFLKSWQYADVFLVALILSRWNICRISGIVVDALCAQLTTAVSEFFKHGLFQKNDAQLYRLTMKIEVAFYVLAVSTFLLSVLNNFVVMATALYFLNKKTVRSPVGGLTFQSKQEAQKALDELEPAPVSLTDVFECIFVRERSLLVSEDSGSSQLAMNASAPRPTLDFLKQQLDKSSIRPSE